MEDLESLAAQVHDLPAPQPVNEFGWPSDLTFGLDALAKRTMAFRARIDAEKAAKLASTDNEVLASVFPLD